VRDLASGLGAQPPGLALGAVHPPFGAAGGSAGREQAFCWALLGGVGLSLAVQVTGELGELVHDGHLLSGQ
jgi:hypothetical protein